ncbi:MAG: TlpA family protein disulfide reductase [Salinibacter sp.]
MTHMIPLWSCRRRSGGALLLLVLLMLGGLGCQSDPEDVQSHLEGRITVRSSVDTSDDYSGFRVLAVRAQGRTLDTLGRAVTRADGRFETTVTAPERGIYSLTIWGRRGRQRLASTDYVVADGDSATLNVELPLQRGRFRVRSTENAALMAYQNTMAQHRRTLLRRVRGDALDSTAMSRSVRQTTSILWSLRETFPGTYASQLGATESLSLLAGWNDSLVVERARRITPSNPRYVGAARIARRAQARLRGQDAALKLLTDFQTRAATAAQRAGIQSIRVRAFIDSLQADAALAAAQTLKNEYPDTRWADWADRATYEVNNLLPGTTAPNLAFRTLEGDSLSLRALRGRPVVLEYFRPGNDLYARQLTTRNALYRGTRSDSVAFVSVSVNPDTLIHRAFTRNRAFPGHTVIAPDGLDGPLARTYNVGRVPSRVLIDAEGRIVGRYPGTAFLALQEELARLLQNGD